MFQFVLYLVVHLNVVGKCRGGSLQSFRKSKNPITAKFFVYQSQNLLGYYTIVLAPLISLQIILSEGGMQTAEMDVAVLYAY